MSDDRKIEAVIFDMDGVLSDSEPLINAAAVAMFQEKGLAVQPEDFHPFLGSGDDRYLGGVAAKYDFAIDLLSAKKRTCEIYLDRVASGLEAFPGAVELVRVCKNAGLKVAVASSGDRIKIEASLNKIGLPPEMWDAIVTAEEVPHKKPEPDIYLAAARKLGLSPEQCVAIEDAVSGVQAAKGAGMRCVAVAHTFPPEPLQFADLVKQRVSELSLDDLVGPAAGPARGVAVPPLPIQVGQDSVERASTETGPWGFWATLGLGLCVAVAYLGTQYAVMIVSIVARGALNQELSAQLAANGLFVALATCATTPVAVGLIWVFARMRKGIPVREYLALSPLSWRAAARWCSALAGLVVLSDGLTTLLHRPIVPEVMVQMYQSAVFPPLFWLAVVVAAPLGEEAFFRGFLFKGILHSRLGGPGAVVLTALVWAVIHQQYDLYGVANVFVAGLLLGFARLRTNSIYTGLLMHALMNLIATIEVAVVIHLGAS
jgi:beta-phosphoglucomutase-like phosphatase (HAD superfamily)/membrane protease YdiL (CAAX protease family)